MPWIVVLALALAVATAGSAQAQALVATRAIPSRTVLDQDDIALVDRVIPGALTAPEAAIGLETRVTIYAGRAIRAADVGPAAIVERNQVVKLRYRHGALSIQTDGRALDRAGVGDTLRVMNLSSKTIVSGFVHPDSTVEVMP